MRVKMHTCIQRMLAGFTAIVIATLAAKAVEPELPIGQNEPPIPDDLSIETTAPVADDQIRDRLSSIYNEISELSGINVAVHAGVVTLSGTVSETQDKLAAVALAERTEGVVYVLDRIERQVDVGSRLSPALTKARELWRSTLRTLPLLLVALTVAALMTQLGRVLARRRSWWERLGLGGLGSGLLERSIRLVFFIIGVVAALEILDATALAGALLGFVGVIGIALGFAFRNIVENYLAGVLLGMRNPFAPGDVIELDNRTGKVIRLTSRDTVLMTLDGNHLRIPNRKVMDSELVNFSRNPRRRFDFAVGVSVEQDLVATRQLGLDTITAVSGVLQDPKPWGVIEELGDSTVNLRFYAWIDLTKSDFLRTRSESIRRIKEVFDEAGIDMPEPIYRVHLMEKGAAAPSSHHNAKRTELSSSPAEENEGLVDDTLDRQIELSERGCAEENLLTEDPSNT